MSAPDETTRQPDRSVEAAARLDTLKRNRTVRTAILYVAGAWASLQAVDLVFPLIGLQREAIQWVLWMLGVGFVLAVTLSWLLEAREERGGDPLRVVSAQTVLLVLLLAGIGTLAASRVDPWLDVSGHDPHALAVAVMPFEVLGSEIRPGLVEGLGGDLAAALSRFGLVVLYETDEPSEPLQAARRVVPHFQIEGSVQVGDDRARIRAHLRDARSRELLWSESYDRALDDTPMLDLQRDVARRIAATVGDRTGVLARASRFSESPRSTPHRPIPECIALADRYFDQHDEIQHRLARECLESAVERTPDHAEAWAHLAYLYREEHLHRRNERLSALDRALRASHRAIALDPTSPMAQFALATTSFSRGDFDVARIAADRAVALNDADATLLGLLATQFAAMGDWERAVGLASRAADLSPHHPAALHNVLALAHYHEGDYAAALEAHQRIGSLDTMRGVTRAATLARLDRTDEARELIERLASDDPFFAADPWRELERSYVDDSLVEDLAEGLRLAGVELAPSVRENASRSSPYPTRSRGRR